MRVKVHFTGRHPSSAMESPVGTPWGEVLSKSLSSLNDDQCAAITSIYIFSDDSEQPLVVVRESSPYQ